MNIDLADVFFIASSLQYTFNKKPGTYKLSELFGSYDEFIRWTMGVAVRFESWASVNVDWPRTYRVWPYLVNKQFGQKYRKLFPFPEEEFAQMNSEINLTDEQCEQLIVALGFKKVGDKWQEIQ